MPDAIHGFPVLARKASSYAADADVVLVDRGPETYERYVTGLVNGGEASPESWFWGHYFNDVVKAVSDYDQR